jgi:RND family efflux transporter MFP subunit
MNMHTPISSDRATPYDLVANDGRAPRRIRLWILLGALLVAALIATWAIFGRAKPAVVETPKLPQVTVMVPATRAVTDEVRATGSIAARRDMPVGVQGEGGLVTRVYVDAGQFVRRGQVLATIDRSVMVQQVAGMAAGIRTARADAALAQSELDRAAKLVSKGFISKADIERRTATRDGNLARVSVAQAQLGEMQARLGRLDVRAPAAGLVLTRNVEAGQVVGAGGTPLFRIAEGGTLELRAQVAEQDLARLKVGLPAAVRPVGSATSYRGRIWLLDPVIDATSRQGIARIALAYSPGLRVGAFANTTIVAGETMRPVVPQSAIQVDSEGSFVYVVGAGNTVVRRAVVVGAVSDTGVSIASGLTDTDRVVVSAAAFLRPGEKISPVAAAQR